MHDGGDIESPVASVLDHRRERQDGRPGPLVPRLSLSGLPRSSPLRGQTAEYFTICLSARQPVGEGFLARTPRLSARLSARGSREDPYRMALRRQPSPRQCGDLKMTPRGNPSVPRLSFSALARSPPSGVTSDGCSAGCFSSRHHLNAEGLSARTPVRSSLAQPSSSRSRALRVAIHSARGSELLDACSDADDMPEISPRPSSAPLTTPRLAMWQREADGLSPRGQSVDLPKLRRRLRAGPTPRTHSLVCPGAGSELAARLWQRRRVVESTQFGSARRRAGNATIFDLTADDSDHDQELLHSPPFARPADAWLSGEAVADVMELRLDLEEAIRQACSSVTAELRCELDDAREEFRRSFDESKEDLLALQTRFNDCLEATKPRRLSMLEACKASSSAAEVQETPRESLTPSTVALPSPTWPHDVSEERTPDSSVFCTFGFGIDRGWENKVQPRLSTAKEEHLQQEFIELKNATNAELDRKVEFNAWREARVACEKRLDEIEKQLNELPTDAHSTGEVNQDQARRLQQDILNLKNATNAELDRKVEYASWRESRTDCEQRLNELDSKMQGLAERDLPTLWTQVAHLRQETERDLVSKVSLHQWEETLQSHEQWMEQLSGWLRELGNREEGLRQVVQHVVEQLRQGDVGDAAPCEEFFSCKPSPSSSSSCSPPPAATSDTVAEVTLRSSPLPSPSRGFSTPDRVAQAVCTPPPALRKNTVSRNIVTPQGRRRVTFACD